MCEICRGGFRIRPSPTVGASIARPLRGVRRSPPYKAGRRRRRPLRFTPLPHRRGEHCSSAVSPLNPREGRPLPYGLHRHPIVGASIARPPFPHSIRGRSKPLPYNLHRSSIVGEAFRLPPFNKIKKPCRDPSLCVGMTAARFSSFFDKLRSDL